MKFDGKKGLKLLKLVVLDPPWEVFDFGGFGEFFENLRIFRDSRPSGARAPVSFVQFNTDINCAKENGQEKNRD